MKRMTKAQLEERVRSLEEALERSVDDLSRAERNLSLAESKVELLEARNKSLVAEKHFWSEHAMSLSNQIETWQRMHRELLEQTINERQDVNLREYARQIAQAIEEAKPPTAMIAATIAMADRNLQVLSPLGFDPGLSKPRLTGEVIDVGDNGDSA